MTSGRKRKKKNPIFNLSKIIIIIIFSFKKAHLTERDEWKEVKKKLIFDLSKIIIIFSFKKANPAGEKQKKRKYLSKVIIFFSFKKAYPTEEKQKKSLSKK